MPRDVLYGIEQLYRILKYTFVRARKELSGGIFWYICLIIGISLNSMAY